MDIFTISVLFNESLIFGIDERMNEIYLAYTIGYPTLLSSELDACATNDT